MRYVLRRTRRGAALALSSPVSRKVADDAGPNLSPGIDFTDPEIYQMRRPDLHPCARIWRNEQL